MIIDSSALFAILLQEPEAERIARAIALDSTRLLSAATWLEISIAVFLRVGEEGLRSLDLLAAKYPIDVVSMTPKQTELARRAFKQYGKGIHPARLNFGKDFLELNSWILITHIFIFGFPENIFFQFTW